MPRAPARAGRASLSVASLGDSQESMASLLLVLEAFKLAAVVAISQQPFPWRNDSANLAVTRGWNKYLGATPFSDDVSGPAISDSPPVALEWTLGVDHPTHTQKDGHGCWIGTEFVVAGGLWETRGSDSPAPPAADAAWAYDTLTDGWSKLPNPPFVQTRGTGACTADSLILVGGRGISKDKAKPWLQPGSKHGSLTVARLTKNQTQQWQWESLTPMPESSYRWLGAAGVCGDWLVVAAGTNTSSFQFRSNGRPDAFLREAVGGAPNDLPVTLPSFRLNLKSRAAQARDKYMPFLFARVLGELT